MILRKPNLLFVTSITSDSSLTSALLENLPTSFASAFNSFNFSPDEVQSCRILSLNSSINIAVRANFQILQKILLRKKD